MLARKRGFVCEPDVALYLRECGSTQQPLRSALTRRRQKTKEEKLRKRRRKKTAVILHKTVDSKVIVADDTGMLTPADIRRCQHAPETRIKQGIDIGAQR